MLSVKVSDKIRCENCKWWGFDYLSVCSFSSNDPKNGMDIDVYAADDTGLEARLITGPEFWCAHFTQKGK